MTHWTTPAALACFVILAACGGSGGDTTEMTQQPDPQDMMDAMSGDQNGDNGDGGGEIVVIDMTPPTADLPRVDPNIVAQSDTITGLSAPMNTINFTYGYSEADANPIFTANVDAVAGVVESFGTTGVASYSGTYRVLSISNVVDADNNLGGDDPFDDVGDINLTVTLGANPTIVGQSPDGALQIDGTVNDTLALTGTAIYNGIEGSVFNIVTDARTIAGAVSGNNDTGGFAGGFFATPD